MTMKKTSIKKCSIDGCESSQYMRGFCRFHYGIEYLLGKQHNKPCKTYNIPQYTAKRSSQVSKYHSMRKVFISAEKEIHPQGKIFCIFCDEEIYGEPDLHHAMGRDDESILDERYWFLAHNFCHVHQYHSISCKDISWWDNYLFRMKNINLDVYKKELLRHSKAE